MRHYELFNVVASGKVRINVNQRFAFKDAADAHKALERGPPPAPEATITFLSEADMSPLLVFVWLIAPAMRHTDSCRTSR